MIEEELPPSSTISDEEKEEEKPEVQPEPEVEPEPEPVEEAIEEVVEEIAEDEAQWLKVFHARRTGLTASQQKIFDKLDTINAKSAGSIQEDIKELIELERLGRIRRLEV